MSSITERLAIVVPCFDEEEVLSITNKECANAIDMGNFYRVPCDKRGLNYDKYFNKGDDKRNYLTEFNSNNTELLNVEKIKEKIASLKYIQERLNEE